MPSTADQTKLPASASHQFQWFGTGHELLEAKLEAITQAKSSVRLEIYIYTAEEIGQRFRTALVDAAKRGVKVSLIVDAVGSLDLDLQYFRELIETPGGQMRWFNRLSLGTWAFRDHRKLLVIDGTIAFVGGCNIAEVYHGDGIDHGWRDGGLRIEGPVVHDLEQAFDQQFGYADEKQWQAVRKQRHKKTSVSAAGGAVRALLVRPGFGRNPLREAISKDLASAKNVAITSAYFLPARNLLRQFSRAVHNGARVRLLLGGKSDVALMQLATRGLYTSLLRRGIEVYEYQPQILHAKLLVIDDVVYVGSSNLDPRSMRINFEIMVRIQDPELAQRARQQFEEDLGRSTRVSKDSCRRRGWWNRAKQKVARWLLARVDPRISEGMLRRLRLRRR